jgi:prevent-host-death family protein
MPTTKVASIATPEVATISPVEAGIRDLRNNLSKYLDRVRAGEEIVVTDHGRAIAKVVPVSGERVLDRLIREGRVTPAKLPRGASRPRIKTKGTVSDLVDEQRR